MATATTRLYEAMFLVDSALAASDWDGTLGAIEKILQRAEAEVVNIRKWSERKLTYEIDHKTRGTYILCFFRADSQRISGIEKDVRLSEKIIRVLILNTEGRPQEMIERDVQGVEDAGLDESPDRERESGRGSVEEPAESKGSDEAGQSPETDSHASEDSAVPEGADNQPQAADQDKAGP